MFQSQEIRQDLQMRLEQRLSQQMILSIELLQLPLLALEERVEQELEENPALELEEPAESDEPAADAGAEEPEADQEEAEDREDPEGALPAAVEAVDAERAFEEQVADMEEEWNESLGSSYRPRGDGDDPKHEAMQNTAAPEESLREYLYGQLALLNAPQRLKDLAELIIYNLDDSGLLSLPLEEVFTPPATAVPGSQLPVASGEGEAPAALQAEAKPESQPGTGNQEPATAAPELPIDPPPNPEEAQEALDLVQSLDPPGVGGRSIEECILIQLRRSPGDTSFEERLVREHFQDLLQNRLPKIAKDMGVDLERIKAGLEVVATMNPRPGALFGGTSAHHVRPDLTVESVGDEYQVRLNDWGLPRLRVSPAYLDLIREHRKDKQLREYAQEKIRSARWLIEAINQRRNTLLKIAREVVGLQREFLEKGVSALKPLPMQEVADRLGLHVSTVSRAMTDKYIQTPQGVFPLRYFTVGGYQTAAGDGESTPAVMARIREMVGQESPEKPLTDQQIVSALRAAGLAVARRTVAKYRERLGIAGSRQRKKY
jgi:RNA polymerase sigma-54 factor